MRLTNLIQGRFVKRYKRFFVDVALAPGKIVTAHSNNTGTMASLLQPGNPVWLEPNDDPKRKLKYTLHLIQVPSGAYVCVNTQLPNQIIFEAIQNQKIADFQEYTLLKREVRFGRENSRVDIYLENQEGGTFIEIKNVTLVEDSLPHVAQFPDAVTERGRKHLHELSYEAKRGQRAVIFYLVNRNDCDAFKVAEHIDPIYAKTLRKVLKQGVEAQIYQTRIEIQNHEAIIELGTPLKFL